MRVIAVEEHYLTQALREAGANHPFVGPGAAQAASSSAPRRGHKHPGAFQRQTVQIGELLLELGEQRLASMDAAGIDVQVVSHSIPDASELEGDLGVRLASEANDFLAGATAAHPDRFLGFATLPMLNPAAAANELRRTVDTHAFVGALINGAVKGRYLEDQFFWPVFEAAEALDVPIYLHPTFPRQNVVEALYAGFDPVITSGLAAGGWGWHIDTGLHVLRLILGGVFDRFPRLQLIIGHMGEALPSMMWRAGAMLDAESNLDRPLHEYFIANIHVTTSGVFDHAALAAAMHALGPDRILFAVDYPYSPNEPGVAFLDSLQISLPDKEKIAHGNAERLLKLDTRRDI